MLHPVPNSTQRARLLAVVKLQRQLMGKLCALPINANVDQVWLRRVWQRVPTDWIRRFWENDNGNRAAWITTIAAASVADKRTIQSLISEQLRFAELYTNPPTIRLTVRNWAPPVFAAVKNLLVSFYAPLFYKDEGFPNADGTRFHKEQYINPRPKVCPYTDNFIQDAKLDHFLPKDQFPMLSCHPDNLIPCSTDANSGSHKGTKVPLGLADPDQAAAWFHPRWRSADGLYTLTFVAPTITPHPQVQFIAVNASDQPRLNNMAQMFGLSDFWGYNLGQEVQSVASDVQGWLSNDGTPPSSDSVKDHVLRRARQERNRVGRDGLAIVNSYYYEHIAQTPALLAQVVRICQNGT